MQHRRVSISRLNGEDIASVLRGEILEVTYQERVEAILIRRPANEEELRILAENLTEMITNFEPVVKRRGRPKIEKEAETTERHE